MDETEDLPGGQKGNFCQLVWEGVERDHIFKSFEHRLFPTEVSFGMVNGLAWKHFRSGNIFCPFLPFFRPRRATFLKSARPRIFGIAPLSIC